MSLRMFFAPPDVKAISRYSEFGSHLGVRAFGITFLIALFLHVSFIGVYAMMPRTKVIKIPVRAININVGMGLADMAPQSEQPTEAHDISLPQAETPQQLKEKDITALTMENRAPQAELEQALADKEDEKPNLAAAIRVPVAPKKIVKEKPPEKVEAPKPVAHAPKRYVRESPLDITGSVTGLASRPEEIRQRYEQSLSVWIQKRKRYPEAVKRRHVEGEAIVRLRINRQGRVLYYVVQKSAGDALLDQAAMAMVRESDPVPSVPQDYLPNEEVFEFLVPVTFKVEK